MSKIRDFYQDSTILITGGTGFLGKLLVEKILRTCQNVNQIYLIMRSKNGMSPQERMDKYFDDQVFLRLKVLNPLCKEKVTVIQGDISCENLSLSTQEEHLLIQTVNIIIHAAASISFNQKLKAAFETNLFGIKKIIELAHNMPNLKSFVHISTVYSNCHMKKIEEKIYDTKLKYNDIQQLLITYNDEELEKMTPSLIGDAPNTYTFTKALAEKYISENCGNLPMGIFRPAIVVSTAKEPISGWIDNFYGPTGLIASSACGLFRIMHGGSDVFSNIVPADMVVNAIIACSWEIGIGSKKLPIYNFVSTQNPLTWGEYVELTKTGLNYPFSKSVWYMSLNFVRKKWVYETLKLILHIIPAYIFDIILRILRQKPYMMRSYKKIHYFVKVLSYFTNRDWEYVNDNTVELFEKMTDVDQKLFDFDMSKLNWNVYFKHYMKGIRIYLFKDDLSNLESARVKYRRLYWAHRLFKYCCLLLFLYKFTRRINK